MSSKIWPVYLGEDFAPRSRVKLLNGSYITQAAIATITREIFFSSSTPTSGPISLTVSSVVYDTLQTWDRDSTGWNFGETLDHTLFPTLGSWKVRYVFTTTGGDVSVEWFNIRVDDPRPTA